MVPPPPTRPVGGRLVMGEKGNEKFHRPATGTTPPSDLPPNPRLGVAQQGADGSEVMLRKGSFTRTAPDPMVEERKTSPHPTPP